MDRPLGSGYVLHDLLGRGAMGEVYLGTVRGSGAAVAVKLLKPELVSDPETVARFFQERSILTSIDHPNGSASQPRVRLTDFGVARLSYGASLTKVSSIIGTPEYMAPEVADHDTAAPSADLYSAGIVLYELLSGRTPFAGGHPLAVLRRHVEQPPPPIPGIPAPLWSQLAALLAKDPRDRPPTAARAADSLALLADSLDGLSPLPVLAQQAPGTPAQCGRQLGEASSRIFSAGDKLDSGHTRKLDVGVTAKLDSGVTAKFNPGSTTTKLSLGAAATEFLRLRRLQHLRQRGVRPELPLRSRIHQLPRHPGTPGRRRRRHRLPDDRPICIRERRQFKRRVGQDGSG